MSKMKLDKQDNMRILYWFHLAFKKKKPSEKDGKTMKKIMLFAECNVDLVQEDADDKSDPFFGRF